MRVVYCVGDKGNYHVTAYGALESVPDDGNIGEYALKELSFTIRQEFGDLRPFAEKLPRGIVSAMEEERREFYEFEVVSGAGKSGRLRILGLADEQGCLPAKPS